MTTKIIWRYDVCRGNIQVAIIKEKANLYIVGVIDHNDNDAIIDDEHWSIFHEFDHAEQCASRLQEELIETA